MSVDAEPCPIVEFLLDDLPRGFGHWTQRIASKINQRLAIFADWKVKVFAEIAQRILRVLFAREILISGELHDRRLRRFHRFKRIQRWLRLETQSALEAARSI